MIYQLGWRDKDRLLGATVRSFMLSFSRIAHTTAFLTVFPFEESVSKTLKKLKGKVFVDIGANVGFYSLLLCRNFDQIIAVEPHPRNMAELRRNLECFGVKNVVCVEKAVSDEDCTTVPLFTGEHDGDYSLVSRRRTMFFERDSVPVKTTTLAKLLSDCRFVDLVKVDVEGAEWLVLSGAEPILDRILAWMVELHDRSPRAKKQMELWSQHHGYDWRWLDTRHIFALKSSARTPNKMRAL